MAMAAVCSYRTVAVAVAAASSRVFYWVSPIVSRASASLVYSSISTSSLDPPGTPIAIAKEQRAHTPTRIKQDVVRGVPHYYIF
eukprot:scaffold251021_cov35-Tisochrysis_lutea.AAC.1